MITISRYHEIDCGHRVVNHEVIFPWERREVWQNDAKSFDLLRYEA